MAELAQEERAVPRLPAPTRPAAPRRRTRAAAPAAAVADKKAPRKRRVVRRRRRKQRDELEQTLVGLLRLYRSLKK